MPYTCADNGSKKVRDHHIVSSEWKSQLSVPIYGLTSVPANKGNASHVSGSSRPQSSLPFSWREKDDRGLPSASRNLDTEREQHDQRSRSGRQAGHSLAHVCVCTSYHQNHTYLARNVGRNHPKACLDPLSQSLQPHARMKSYRQLYAIGDHRHSQTDAPANASLQRPLVHPQRLGQTRDLLHSFQPHAGSLEDLCDRPMHLPKDIQVDRHKRTTLQSYHIPPRQIYTRSVLMSTNRRETHNG